MTPLYVENRVLMVGYFSESTTPWPSIQLAMSYYSLINTKINIRVEHIFTDVKTMEMGAIPLL